MSSLRSKEEEVQNIWEKQIIWDVDKVHKNRDYSADPSTVARASALARAKQDAKKLFNPRYSYEDEEEEEQEDEDGWEKYIIWDAEEFEKQWKRCPSAEQQVSAAAKEENGVVPDNGDDNDKGSGKSESVKVELLDWNISNDQFYQTKDIPSAEVYSCRHSRLVKELIPPFILTHLSEDQLRNFHRPKLAPFDNPATATKNDPRRQQFKSVTKRVIQKAKERRALMEQGYCILFDQPIDLSARDGSIVLVEYSEEFPPLLNQVGMCSQLINFCGSSDRSLVDQYKEPEVPHGYGETHHVSNSSPLFPFLGKLESGQVLSAIGNNMYHSPIFWHPRKETDFLVIRSKTTGYMIREFDGQFVAGQQCPLVEVPEPNSAKLKNFLKDFLQTFVYRKYKACMPTDFMEGSAPTGCVPKVRMDVITQSFPTMTENSIKTILKNSSDLKRMGNVSWMVMKAGFSLPMENDLCDKVTPEKICAYYSLLATDQRLKDSRFDFLLTVSNKDKEKGKSPQRPQTALEEELLSAPWNTTSAFLAAKTGKCYLQVTGPADPTGCGEGFSYVRMTKRGVGGHGPDFRNGRGRPPKTPQPKTGGTDADLRKLSSKKAKELLKKAGVPEKEIQTLSRWAVIDLVRTLSTEKAMQGETMDKGFTKFCRWKSSRSATMNQERYREACQRVFELQNKVLSSREDLSTDEGDSEDEGGDGGAPSRYGASKQDIEEMGKNIERMLSGDTDFKCLSHEEEEMERLELQKMMLGEIMAKDAEIGKRKEALEREKELDKQRKEINSQDILTDLMKNPNKFLKITRTFKEGENSFLRTEIVKDPLIIAAYVRIRESKSDDYIKHFLAKAERTEKKEKRMNARLLFGPPDSTVKTVERKRKREIANLDNDYFPNKEARKEAEKALRRSSRKCGACGAVGHVKTSKLCPNYSPEKVQQIRRKREEKKQLKQQQINPSNQQGKVEQNEAMHHDQGSSDSSNTDSDSSSSSESDEDSSSDDTEDSDEENQQGLAQPSSQSSSQEEPMVKTDGLKMFVNKRGLQGYINMAQQQEEKEQEVARILASMAMESNTPPTSVPRRRISQAERENADYLRDRRYRTTAADRRTFK